MIAAAMPTATADGKRGVEESASGDCDRGPADHAVDHEDCSRESKVGFPALGWQAHIGEYARAVVVPGEQEEVGAITGHLLVVVPDPVDRKAISEVLRAAFDQSDEGHDPEQVDRRQHGERECVEDVADVGELADEAERDEGAGDGEDVDGSPC
jgi:hypothetical protein